MKKALIAIMAFAVLVLAGCSAVDAKLEDIFLEKSGILETEEYLQYQEYLETGMLDENGQYWDSILEEDSADAQDSSVGKIHVTFANNPYLSISYYTDASMKTPIDTSSCYMNPGDTIYAKFEGHFNPNSNLYRLAEFRIVEYYADGTSAKKLSMEAIGGVMEYEIPSNFMSPGISIIPIGEYPDRNLSLSVYYVDDDGNKCSLGNAGTWSINKENIDGNIAQISPIEPYVLRFTYDKENYFYVSCEPAGFTKDPGKEGFVEFYEAEPTDADKSYSVELHKLLSLSLKFSEEAKVKVNNEDFERIKKNGVWSRNNLKYGDCIIIETSGVPSIDTGDYQHISATKDPLVEGDRYTLTVIQSAEGNAAEVLKETVYVTRTFDVTLSTECKYGTCTYKLDGKEVSGTIKVREDQKLTLNYQITDKEYKFADKSGLSFDILTPYKRTIEIPITSDIDGTTIYPDEHFDITRKGE